MDLPYLYSLNSSSSAQTKNTDDALSGIQKSIERIQLNAGSEDILDLTVDFAKNITRNAVNGNGESTSIDNLASASSAFEDIPTEITNSITELFRQLEVALDESFMEACEEIAFYDIIMMGKEYLENDAIARKIAIDVVDYLKKKEQKHYLKFVMILMKNLIY